MGGVFSIPKNLVNKFNDAIFGSTFKGTFLTKLAPATKDQVIVMSNEETTFSQVEECFLLTIKVYQKNK